MKKDSPWPCLVGPTGIGKSEAAYEIAKRLGYEILSCDAFQVYEGLAVGTAQPPLEWQKTVPHHLVGFRKPREGWTAGDFAREAAAILREKQEQGKGVIVVGGAGFYLRALIEGLPPSPMTDPELRRQITKKVEAIGLTAAHEWLKSIHPESAGKIHIHDQYRICRALEKALSPSHSPGSPKSPRLRVALFGIECPREQLDQILRERCVKIWKNGILEETEKLRGSGVPLEFPAWKAIGYREALAYLNRKSSETEALEKMFRRTRQYAKRQWTWFRNQHQVQWFQRNPVENPKELIEQLTMRILKSREGN